MTEMFGEAWSPMSVPDLAPDDDDDIYTHIFVCLFCCVQFFFTIFSMVGLLKAAVLRGT